jgi:hypothetical protein
MWCSYYWTTEKLALDVSSGLMGRAPGRLGDRRVIFEITETAAMASMQDARGFACHARAAARPASSRPLAAFCGPDVAFISPEGLDCRDVLGGLCRGKAHRGASFTRGSSTTTVLAR